LIRLIKAICKGPIGLPTRKRTLRRGPGTKGQKGKGGDSEEPAKKKIKNDCSGKIGSKAEVQKNRKCDLLEGRTKR